MAGDRIVVGATGDDDVARRAARSLRDEGHEIVFVGGHQGAEHLARTAVAEDAVRVVVDAGPAAVDEIADALQDLGAGDVQVVPIGRSDR